MIVTEYQGIKRLFIKVIEEEELHHFIREKIEHYSAMIIGDDDWRLTNDLIEIILHDHDAMTWDENAEIFMTFDKQDLGKTKCEEIRPSNIFYINSILEKEEEASLNLVRIVGLDFEMKLPKILFIKEKVRDLQVALCEELSKGLKHSFSSDSYALCFWGWHVTRKIALDSDVRLEEYFPDFLSKKVSLSASVNWEETSDDEIVARFTTE
jgi:hypothetical protein